MVGKKKNVGVRAPVTRVRASIALLVRVWLIGTVAVGASAWAVYRYYFAPRGPITAPAPTELPAPELLPADPSSSPSSP